MAQFTWPPVTLSPTAIAYNEDSILTSVSLDTVTPSNSKPLPVSVISSTGILADVATSANQTNGTQKAIVRGGAKGVTTAGDVTSSSIDADTQALDVAVKSSALPTGAATETTLSALNTKVPSNLTVTATRLLVDPGTNPVTQSGTWDINNISGTVTLPTGAATEATLATMNTKLPAQGRAAAAASLPVVLSNEDADDLFIIGQAAQTAVINNIITTTAGAEASDVTGYSSATIQVISTGTAGTFIFEGSNNNVNFQTIPVFNQNIITGTAITAAITATASQIGYILPITFRYLRLRIATTITGGSIQAFTKLSRKSYAPPVQQVSNATGTNLNVAIASGTVTTVSTVTAVSANATTYTNADVASAAITTTTNGATITVVNGCSIALNVAITAVSGTSPTYDFSIQESGDGTNWVTIYSHPRQTATGFFVTPLLRLNHNRYRVVETIGGTTPSFTRAITSSRTDGNALMYRSIIDRSIAPATTNSTSAILTCPNTNSYIIKLVQGTGGSNVTFALDGSDDGVLWQNSVITLTGVNDNTSLVSTSISGVSFRFVRLRVVTGVASATINYVELIATQGASNIVSAKNSSATAGATTSVGTSAVTETAPADAVGFILYAASSNTGNIFYVQGTTATTANGLMLEASRDTGFIPCAANISLISDTAAQGYRMYWVRR